MHKVKYDVYSYNYFFLRGMYLTTICTHNNMSIMHNGKHT